MPNLENYYKANDKGLLAEHLVKHQILTPKSFLMKAGEKFDGIKNLSFPILTKPTLGFYGGEGIFKFNNIEDLKLHLNSNILGRDYKKEGIECIKNILKNNKNLLEIYFSDNYFSF